MPLTEEQKAFLGAAIRGYSFPAVYYDFQLQREVRPPTMVAVEDVINGQLRSADAQDVEHGLTNILYWGYANVGYRDTRIEDLNSNITTEQVRAFQALVANGRTPTMAEVKSIRIPQYSGMSFLSKVLMFLNPTEYCILDRQITRLRTGNAPKALNQLSFGPNETQIKVFPHNEAVYDCWRGECLEISETYFENEHRVVDIERGFFHLIQQGHLPAAHAIYNNA
jgi:hypothetical protein